MISSKTTFYLLFLALFLSLKIKAQDHFVHHIDSMLVIARSTLVTNPEQTSSISKEIYQLSLDHEYAKGQDYGLLLLNFGYFNARKFDLVISGIGKLKTSATKHDNFEVLLMSVLLEARTLARIQHYQKGLEEIEKAFPIINNIASKNSKAMYKGLTYQMTGHLLQSHSESRDSIFGYFLKAKNEFQKVHDVVDNGFIMYTKDDLLYTNYAFLANEFMAQKNSLDSVDYYLDSALKLHPKYKDNVSDVLINNNIGWRFLDKSNFEQALKHYNKSVEISKKYNQKEALIYAYDGLSIVYHEMKDYENASIYANLLRLLQEEVSASNQQVISRSVENMLNENDIKLKTKNDKLSRIIIIITVLTVILLYASFIFYKKFKKEKLTKKQIEVLLKEKMESISHESQEINSEINEFDLEEIIKLAINNDVAFYIKFQEVFPDFINKLLEIAPSIVTSELKFAAYIKLDFSTKEIARYTNSSVRSVEAKKYRLRKKLNIPTEEDTNIWMSQI